MYVKEIADGLEIVDKEGNKHTITAIQLREELFNRYLFIAISLDIVVWMLISIRDIDSWLAAGRCGSPGKIA